MRTGRSKHLFLGSCAHDCFVTQHRSGVRYSRDDCGLCSRHCRRHLEGGHSIARIGRTKPDDSAASTRLQVFRAAVHKAGIGHTPMQSSSRFALLPAGACRGVTSAFSCTYLPRQRAGYRTSRNLSSCRQTRSYHTASRSQCNARSLALVSNTAMPWRLCLALSSGRPPHP